jgi:hypothetical protein
MGKHRQRAMCDDPGGWVWWGGKRFDARVPGVTEVRSETDQVFRLSTAPVATAPSAVSPTQDSIHNTEAGSPPHEKNE